MLKRDYITVFVGNYFATMLSRDNFTFLTDFFENITTFRNLIVSFRQLPSKLPACQTIPIQRRCGAATFLFTNFNAANNKR
jgi:hypothetical protein